MNEKKHYLQHRSKLIVWFLKGGIDEDKEKKSIKPLIKLIT